MILSLSLSHTAGARREKDCERFASDGSALSGPQKSTRGGGLFGCDLNTIGRACTLPG